MNDRRWSTFHSLLLCVAYCSQSIIARSRDCLDQSYSVCQSNPGEASWGRGPVHAQLALPVWSQAFGALNCHKTLYSRSFSTAQQRPLFFLLTCAFALLFRIAIKVFCCTSASAQIFVRYLLPSLSTTLLYCITEKDATLYWNISLQLDGRRRCVCDVAARCTKVC